MKYTNPPITEAIFDLRVNLPKETSLDTLLSFQNEIKDRFPTKKERHLGSFEIKPGGAPAIVSSSDKTDGFLFNSPDNKKIVQARLDGFTFNKLKPYSDWETFSGEAKELWGRYVSIAKPINVVRLALRYINRVEMPLPFSDFKEYVLTEPEIAPGLPQGLSGFFMQLVIPNDSIFSTAVITETIEKIDQNSKAQPLIFDIDASCNMILEPNSKTIGKVMEDLRNFKNQIFERSFTVKAKELFK